MNTHQQLKSAMDAFDAHLLPVIRQISAEGGALGMTAAYTSTLAAWYASLMTDMGTERAHVLFGILAKKMLESAGPLETMQ